MRRLAALLSLAVCGCDQDQSMSRAEFNHLQDRIEALEVTRITPRATSTPQAPREPVAPSPPRPRESGFMLIGTSFNNDRGFRYETRAACENARQELLRSWSEDDIAGRQRGILVTSRPTPSCLPL